MSAPALTPFHYDSVRVDNQGAVITRSAHTASGFVERLSASTDLTLIEIPAARTRYEAAQGDDFVGFRVALAVD